MDDDESSAWYLYTLALAAALVTVLGMLTLVASVVMGAMTVGSLWSLFPLAFYALAFWLLAHSVRDM